MIGDVVGAVGVVLAVVFALLFATSRRSLVAATTREERAASRVATAEELARRWEVQAADLAEEARAADQRAAAAEEARAAEQAEPDLAEEAADTDTGPETSGTVWALTELQQRWARRDEAGLSTAPFDPAGADGLTGGLGLEIERIREEAGTPGDLTLELDVQPAAGLTLLVLRSLQVLLEVVTRRCDSYDLAVRSDETELSTELTCHGFDGGPAVLDDAGAALAILADAGVDTTIATSDDGTLAARLVFTVTPTR
jgi:hypothetical protein